MFHVIMRCFDHLGAQIAEHLCFGCRPAQRPSERCWASTDSYCGQDRNLCLDSSAGIWLSCLNAKQDHRHSIRRHVALPLIALADGKRPAFADHRISFHVSSRSHFHALPESGECVSPEIVSSGIGLHGIGHRPVAPPNGMGSIGVLFIHAPASSLTM